MKVETIFINRKTGELAIGSIYSDRGTLKFLLIVPESKVLINEKLEKVSKDFELLGDL